MEHNQQNNQGLMHQFQSLISGLFPHANQAAGQSDSQPSSSTSGSSDPPPYTAVDDTEMTPADGSSLNDSTSVAAAPSTSHEPPELPVHYDSDASMPSLQTVSDTSEQQDNEDVEMMTLPGPSQQEASTSTSTSSSTPVPNSIPSSSTRTTRRARVEDETDEEEMRERNRQRMNSPVPPQSDRPDDHHFHPDLETHRTAGRGTPVFSRVTYVVDVMPPGMRAGPSPTQGGVPPPMFFPFPMPAPVPATNHTEGNTVPSDQDVPLAPEADAEGQPPAGAAEFYAFLNTLRERFGNLTMPWGIFGEEEQEDPVRAQKLLRGLEGVSVGLVKRMEQVGGDESEKPVCAICFEDLLNPDAGGFQSEQKDEPTPMVVESDAQSSSSSSTSSSSATFDEEKKLAEALKHKVVVLPCSHVFHASCLLPWFTRPHRTTCPTCRFDIDPESLTLTPPSARRPRRRRQPQTEPAAEAGATASAPASAPAPAPAPTPAAEDAPVQAGPAPAEANAAYIPQPQPGLQPRVHARRTIRTADLPFGLVVDVSVFPGPMPTAAPSQPGQGPTFHIPFFGGTTPPAQPTQPQGQAPQEMPFPFPLFGLAPPQATANPPAGNTANSNPNARPFNPGMAGLGFIPAEFQLFFGPPPPHAAHPPAPTNNNADNTTSASTAAPQSQATGPAPQASPRSPQIHIHGDPGASAILADMLGLGRFQPPAPPGSVLAEQQRREQQQPLPSFQEFVNMSLPAQGPAGANQPAEGAPPQPQPQQAGLHGQGVPPDADAEAQVNAMADTLARTLFQQILFGAPPAPADAVNDNANAPPVPPGPIPFTIPRTRPARQRGEKKQWAPPPPPGATLRERIERKEREMGLRCSDISCGLGPTDEDPTPVVDPRAVRQIAVRPLPGQGDGKAAACEHKFHPACLVSAERVAGWSGADQKREVEGDDDVEVSCPVCRAVGRISRADWDEGACALA